LRDTAASADENPARAKKARRVIKNMIGKDPLFLRGYAVLAQLCEDADDEDQATELYVQGCRAALKIMPGDFQGSLNTDDSDVQCFLRCHAGYVESLLAQGDYQAALEASHRQLAFDPEDMFERRRELGELSILAGRPGEAEAILREQVGRRPTAHYSLGYLAFSGGDFPAAITHLRRGFLLAPYAVDLLTGRLTPPNPFWDEGPQAPDYREDLLFVEMLGGDLWTREKEAHAFIEWLSLTGPVLMERARMVLLAETCLRADGPKADAALQAAEAEFQAILGAVDETSSAALTASVIDPVGGEEVAPWELLARHQQRLTEDDGWDPEHDDPDRYEDDEDEEDLSYDDFEDDDYEED
jgi:tetratricopeptide (TPR) repeat protein